MRAAQVVRLIGPSGVEMVSVGEPEPGPGEFLVDVHAAGLSYPDLLLSRGQYQMKPELPFTLGIDFAGVVRGGPAGCDLAAGDRVAGWGPVGGAADVVAAGPEHLFPLPGGVSYLRGACLPLNYLTAHYALIIRAGLQAGETVLVHGASGGLGTAAIQVAAAFGGRVIGVVSSEGRRPVATAAGAAAVVLADGFGAQARELTGGAGVDIVLDLIGGEQRVIESLRALAPLGRLLAVGFAGGEIASVKLNRLLLGNIDVRGVAWGPYTRLHPQFPRQQWAELLPLIVSGRLAPVIGAVYPLAEAGRALADLAQRRLTGKAVLSLREAISPGGP